MAGRDPYRPLAFGGLGKGLGPDGGSGQGQSGEEVWEENHERTRGERGRLGGQSQLGKASEGPAGSVLGK